MIETYWRKLRKEYQKRRAVLDRLWMPVGLPLSVLFLAGAAFEFVEGHGVLSLPVGGLLLLALIVFVSAPVHAIRVSTLRIMAFTTDVALLGTFTFAVIWLLRMGGGTVGGPELMVMMWLWFGYFVVWDCWFRGTAGKRSFGLRLTCIGGGLSFPRCFIRTSLTLLAPIILATLLLEALRPNASVLRFCAAVTLHQAVLAFIPISVLLFGGNRGIVDRLVGSEVVSRRTNMCPSIVQVGPKTWALLLVSSVTLGMLFAWLGYLAYGRSLFGGTLEPSPSKYIVQYWRWDEPAAIGHLWQVLPQGLGDPTKSISDIAVRVARPNPFTFAATASVA